MKLISIDRRTFARLVVAGTCTAVAILGGGCAAPAIPKVVLVVLTWIGVFATTGCLILQAEEQYWKVESAKLDVAKKRLELEGVKEGQRVRGERALNDAEIDSLLLHKKVVINWLGHDPTTISVVV